MANVQHSTLTGSDLHEPKGVAAASASTVYVADGLGSGSWTSASTFLSFSGMIADFATPVAPTGWLECDGSLQLRSTYAPLFAAITIQQSGTRTTSSQVITGLSNTANMKAGYFVSGTGIPVNTIISTVDSGTQITLNQAATTSGTSTVVVSPWGLGDGTTQFSLPDLKTAGRYRRSRTAATAVGISQADSFAPHTHTGSVSGTTSGRSADHTHNFSGTTAGASVRHTHTEIASNPNVEVQAGAGVLVGGTQVGTSTGTDSPDHAHTFSGTTGGESADHTHTFSASFTTGSTGATETRPISIVVMTCIKT